jgi:hypothetical protein
MNFSLPTIQDIKNELDNAFAGAFFAKPTDSTGLKITNFAIVFFAAITFMTAVPSMLAAVVKFGVESLMNRVTIYILTGDMSPGNLETLAESAKAVADARSFINGLLTVIAVSTVCLGVCVAFKRYMYPKAYAAV